LEVVRVTTPILRKHRQFSVIFYSTYCIFGRMDTILDHFAGL